MLSCQRCKQTTNGPQAFLLTCRVCSKTWHHRCHMPAVEDDELMQRIRATNVGNKDNDLYAWMCRRCRKATASVMSSREPTEQSSAVNHVKQLRIVDQQPLTPTAESQPSRNVDVQMTVARPSLQTPVVRSVEIPSEDDANMSVDVSTPCSTPHATSRASQPPSSDSEVVSPHYSLNEREAERVVIQDAEVEDDPEDLYGPPVERHIIRILPSLADELREQQRRAAAEKEAQQKLTRAPLAPDWILARHIHDPLWKIRPTAEGRKRRKRTARKLGDNGLNVSELVGYLTLQSSVREHRIEHV